MFAVRCMSGSQIESEGCEKFQTFVCKHFIIKNSLYFMSICDLSIMSLINNTFKISTH